MILGDHSVLDAEDVDLLAVDAPSASKTACGPEAATPPSLSRIAKESRRKRPV
jgi:hypothetical protein